MSKVNLLWLIYCYGYGWTKLTLQTSWFHWIARSSFCMVYCFNGIAMEHITSKQKRANFLACVLLHCLPSYANRQRVSIENFWRSIFHLLSLLQRRFYDASMLQSVLIHLNVSLSNVGLTVECQIVQSRPFVIFGTLSLSLQRVLYIFVDLNITF